MAKENNSRSCHSILISEAIQTSEAISDGVNDAAIISIIFCNEDVDNKDLYSSSPFNSVLLVFPFFYRPLLLLHLIASMIKNENTWWQPGHRVSGSRPTFFCENRPGPCVRLGRDTRSKLGLPLSGPGLIERGSPGCYRPIMLLLLLTLCCSCIVIYRLLETL